MFVAFGVLGSLAVSAVKISALDLFNHIFPNETFHRASYLVMGMLGSYGIAFAIVSLASCKPFAFNWDKEITSGTCIDTSRFYVSQTILGVVFDVIVVALPMPMLWGLQMKVQKKVALTCIFGVGLLICVISIFRAVLNNDVGLQKSDFPYYAGIALILATFENNLSIICASLPVMQPVLKNLTRIIKSTFSRSGGSNTTSPLWSSPPKAKGQRGNPRFGASDEAKFNRLHDHLYPLASSTHQLSYEGAAATTRNTAERAGSGDVLVEMDDLQREATQPHSAIAVTRAWEVSSKASAV